ncbi:unnamed protein product [Ambrosiozyma monospora]|uniref:Unnamed protein product n=1 Tax=Ambrosiozyma monospora TaxID=43982 RepID=A0ACB5TPX4_AMBMO|nr:unnamed protein product [Ambrosiozyma monospora]
MHHPHNLKIHQQSISPGSLRDTNNNDKLTGIQPSQSQVQPTDYFSSLNSSSSSTTSFKQSNNGNTIQSSPLPSPSSLRNYDFGCRDLHGQLDEKLRIENVTPRMSDQHQRQRQHQAGQDPGQDEDPDQEMTTTTSTNSTITTSTNSNTASITTTFPPTPATSISIDPSSREAGFPNAWRDSQELERSKSITTTTTSESESPLPDFKNKQLLFKTIPQKNPAQDYSLDPGSLTQQKRRKKFVEEQQRLFIDCPPRGLGVGMGIGGDLGSGRSVPPSPFTSQDPSVMSASAHNSHASHNSISSTRSANNPTMPTLTHAASAQTLNSSLSSTTHSHTTNTNSTRNSTSSSTRTTTTTNTNNIEGGFSKAEVIELMQMFSTNPTYRTPNKQSDIEITNRYTENVLNLISRQKLQSLNYMQITQCVAIRVVLMGTGFCVCLLEEVVVLMMLSIIIISISILSMAGMGIVIVLRVHPLPVQVQLIMVAIVALM